jgi:VIT1/CCC1 family predicted Fe2+/Mn2+ transporter
MDDSDARHTYGPVERHTATVIEPVCGMTVEPLGTAGAPLPSRRLERLQRRQKTQARGDLTRSRLHTEKHLIARIAWLRAAVLGANDGVLSTGSLILGVAAASTAQSSILLSGVAGLVAGAMSMAAGEYVSVSSQSDAETADLARERRELAARGPAEHDELAAIYVGRGVSLDLANQVAEQLMAKDALAAHAKDELGITEATTARPLQAALASAASFAVGAALPLIAVLLSPKGVLSEAVAISSLLFLAALGAVGAKAGGASMLRAIVRVTFWGAMAMVTTAGIGSVFGVLTRL